MPRKKSETIAEISIYEGEIHRVIGGQYFGEDLALYITPIYVVITYRNPETGEEFEILDIAPYILFARLDEQKVGLIKYDEKILRMEFNLYSRSPPDVSEVRLPRQLINDLHSEGRIRVFMPHTTFDMVKSVIDKYLDTPDSRIIDFFTLWIMGTYVYTIFDTYPYIYIQGMKESGKTKILEIFSLLAYNARSSVSITPSSLFRVVESTGCTLLIDESEEIAADKGIAIKRLLYSGYRKHSGKVYRVEESEIAGRRKRIPMEFEVYSPKAMANIEGIEDILEDRCISITTLRGRNRTKIMRIVDPRDSDALMARYALYSCSLFFFKSLREVYQEIIMPPIEIRGMSGRLWELWRPIYSLACWVTGSRHNISPVKIAFKPNDYPFMKRLISFIEERIEAKRIVDESANLDYLVAKALAKLVDHDDWYRVTDIKDEVLGMIPDDSPMVRKVNSRKISDILKRHFGFEKIRTIGNRRFHYIELSRVNDILERLGISREEIIKEEAESFAEEIQARGNTHS